jgi:hypothetical protein
MRRKEQHIVFDVVQERPPRTLYAGLFLIVDIPKVQKAAMETGDLAVTIENTKREKLVGERVPGTRRVMRGFDEGIPGRTKLIKITRKTYGLSKGHDEGQEIELDREVLVNFWSNLNPKISHEERPRKRIRQGDEPIDPLRTVSAIRRPNTV